MLGDILVDHLFQNSERDGSATKDHVMELPDVESVPLGLFRSLP